MRPPDCCLCDRGLATNDDCEWVCFQQTESDKQWHADAASPEGLTGHPPDCDWFCEDHAETARSMSHHDRSTALERIKTQECWQVIYIDLFDRDTPPMVNRRGVGLESGFAYYWDHLLAAVRVDGGTYPSDYRLGFADDGADLDLERTGDEVMTIKRYVTDRPDEAKLIRKIAFGHAFAMRAGGRDAASQWLDQLCNQIQEDGEPDLLRPR